MNAKVNVLSVLDRLIGNARTTAGLTGDPRMRDNLRDGEQARAAVAELIEAAERADKLISLLTVRQVIKAGDTYIEAAGLNTYCMNEGLAEGGERIRLSCLELALANIGSTK